jgi:hypothetical protein
MGIDILIPDCVLGLGYFYCQRRSMTKNEPIAFFDPQEKGFYWAKPTKITAPTIVDVEPLPLYTQRTWVGLTDEEQRNIAYSDINCWDWGELMDAVEAKLKEKNG